MNKNVYKQQLSRALCVLYALLLTLNLPAYSASPKVAASQWGKEDVTRLPDAIAKMLKTNGINPKNASIYIQKIEDDKPIVAYNSTLGKNPASVIKLLTSVLGLDVLGASYRWPTKLYYRGNIIEGRLNGDLYIQGFGDPFFTLDRLYLLQARIRTHGISHITGNVIIDDSYFAPTNHDQAEFDSQPYRTYNVGAAALAFNFKSFELWYDSSQSKDLSVQLLPAASNVSLEINTRATSNKCSRWKNRLNEQAFVGDAGELIIKVTGRHVKNCSPRNSIMASLQPAWAYAGGVFTHAWEASGGEFGGTIKQGEVPAAAKLLLTDYSPDLRSVLGSMNKFSNNFIARNLFLSLLHEKDASGLDISAARELTRQWLKERGLLRDYFFIDNGSGLSRETRISVLMLAQILYWVYFQPYRAELVSSLPVIGDDGTMRKRLKKSHLTGHGHLKTGSLRGVSSLAGYVHYDGNDYVVVSIITHAAKWKIRQFEDQLLTWLGRL